MSRISRIYRRYKNQTREFQVEKGALTQYQESLSTQEKQEKITVIADAPDSSYDKLSLNSKLKLAQKFTTVSIQFLQQNGFTVTPRPSPPTPS